MKALLLQLRWLFSPQDKKKFLLLILMMSFSALLEMAGIGLLLGAAALFLSPETPASSKAMEIVSALLPGLSNPAKSALAVAGIALLLTAKNVFAFMIVKYQNRFITTKQADLARRMFDTYIYADNEFFRQIPPDEAFTNINRITQLITMVFLPAMQIFADTLVIAILMLTVLLLFPGITVAASVFMIAAGILISGITRKINRRLGKAALQSEIEEQHICLTGITGEKIIKSEVAGKYFNSMFAKKYHTYAGCLEKLYTLGQIPRFALESLAVITAAGIFCTLQLCQTPQSETMLILAVLTAAVARILPALSRCHYNLTQLRQNFPLLEKTFSVLSGIPAEDLTVKGEAADASQTIRLENVSFAYQNGRKIFENFSLELPPFSATAIAGKSGRGKSTLAELLLALLKTTSGTITAGKVNICNDIISWRRQIGYVPQNVFIFSGSLRENVAFGIAPEDIDDSKVAMSLQMAQLAEISPDAEISPNNLSGGQKQRLGIARALYRDAKLLILDEVTSALDPATEKSLCDALKELRGKVTLLIISHRESTLQCCDRIITL